MDNVINGFIAGSAQTIIGHPFDTIKTRIQMGNCGKSGNLYHGFFPILIGGCFQNSFLFGTEKYFEKHFTNNFWAGFASGGISTLLISPAEFIKCNQQKNSDLSIKKMINQRNIMRGFWTTFVRDSVGFGIYFSLYNWLQKKENNPLINGGISGVASWIYSYPIDTIKTLQQTRDKKVMEVLEIITMDKLCKGMGWMLGRAFLVNAGIFYIFEKIKC